MIKILKPGRDPKNYAITYKKTCQRCSCEFEFEEADCDSVEYEKRLGGAVYAEITCPHCHSKLLCRLDEHSWSDLFNDNDTWKIHPEYDPYYDVHVDKYDITKDFNFDSWASLSDDYNNYFSISKINSVDNYKLPDDYASKDFMPFSCEKCNMPTYSDGSDYKLDLDECANYVYHLKTEK